MPPTVICLGECLIDRIFDRYDGDHPQVPFWVDYPGGAPANVATALAKLGTPVGFIGCVGPDAQGDRLAQTLSQAGVNCEGLQRSAAAPTRVVLVRRDAQGERSFVGFSQADPTGFADAQLDPEQISPHWFAAADYLVMGTLGLAYPKLQASMAKAMQWAQQYGLATVVDLNWRPQFWPQPELAPSQIRRWLDQVDILKLNQAEAQWLFQTPEAEAIQRALPRAKLVLVTAGAAGCQYATPTWQGQVPAFAVDCEDTTGAGDSFLAAFIHQLVRQGRPLLKDLDQLRAAVQYASAAGALTTTQAGAMAAQPDAKAVEAFLYLHQL
ncbi:MAG TPA: carbohydrate kinase [Leptolyngbyaceae cyanobacterium M65_K2018_010]|nr:carbohydrate kinase [Leptolyngbyaceae cyanobacterium M65_K2018_010]